MAVVVVVCRRSQLESRMLVMTVSLDDCELDWKLIFFCVVRVVRSDGSEAVVNELGRLLVKLPLPPGTMSTLYGNDELFCKTYFVKYPVSGCIKFTAHMCFIIHAITHIRRVSTTQWTPAISMPTAMFS